MINRNAIKERMKRMNWLRRFMAGRYGVDQLSIALLVFYLLLALVGQFTRLPVLTWLALLPLLLCWFRVFSRNSSKRYQENCVFLKYWNPVTLWFRNQKARFRDRKTHRYFKCHNCSNTLRVPKGRGKIQITCPVCRKEFIRKT